MKLSPKINFAVMAGLLAAGVTAFTSAAVQQNYRFSADLPQLQMAEDGATALDNGKTAAEVVGAGQVDAASSLAPFMIVFDASKHVLATSGMFAGKTLTPPAGTFDNAKAKGYERFTWQTSTGAREAAVLVYTGGPHPGYVLASRSLREVEVREHNLDLMTLVTLVAIVLVTAGFTFLL
jgi:hypothetical protein